MQQNDIAVVALLLYPLQNDIRSRSGPILRVDVLQDDEIILVLRDLQRSQLSQARRLSISGVGRPKQSGSPSSQSLDEQLSCVQFQPNMLGPAEGKIGVIIGVITYFVTLIDNAPNEIWVTFGIDTYQKKRGLYLRRLQHIEDLWRPLRIRSIVKCQCHFVCVTGTLMIQGRELRKFGIVGGEIIILVHCQSAHSIGARFVYRHDLAISNVGDGVSPAQNLQERTRGQVEPEIRRDC